MMTMLKKRRIDIESRQDQIIFLARIMHRFLSRRGESAGLTRRAT